MEELEFYLFQVRLKTVEIWSARKHGPSLKTQSPICVHAYAVLRMNSRLFNFVNQLIVYSAIIINIISCSFTIYF